MLLPTKIETEIEKVALFTYLIIGANLVIFLSMRFLPPSVLEMAYYDYGFVAEDINLLPTFTSLFIHAGWLHLIGNMYFLWLFGRAVEQRMNRSAYALLYFSSGIAGSFIQGYLTPQYLADIPCIGASGAISGILGAYIVAYPWEEVSCIYISFSMRYATSITLSSIWVLGSWFIFQFINALWFSPKTAEVSVAYWAHIGGFAFGATCTALPKYSAAFAGMLRRRTVSIALNEYSDLLHHGRMDEAAARLKSALKADPSNALAIGELGRFELTRENPSRARRLFRRSLKKAIKQKDDAKAVAAYLSLVAAGAMPPDNSQRLIIGRRFARLKKYGHALGIMGSAFRPDPGAHEMEMQDLDKLLYEIGELFAGSLKDFGRAAAAYNLLIALFPHSPRSLDADYQLRKLKAGGKI